MVTEARSRIIQRADRKMMFVLHFFLECCMLATPCIISLNESRDDLIMFSVAACT